jgi:transposase
MTYIGFDRHKKLRGGLIPEVYVPSAEIRAQKMLWRERIWLVRMHVRLKNRIHRLLNHYHIEVPEFSDLFGAAGRTIFGKTETSRTRKSNP